MKKVWLNESIYCLHKSHIHNMNKTTHVLRRRSVRLPLVLSVQWSLLFSPADAHQTMGYYWPSFSTKRRLSHLHPQQL